MDDKPKELDAQKKELVVKQDNVPVKLDWTHSNELGDMMRKAEVLCKSSLVPFKDPEDVVLVWQYAKDVGLSFSQAVTELYAIPGKAGKRVSAGVHIHEGLILASGKGSYSVIEYNVEVRHYKIRGLGVKVMSIDEVMKGIDSGYYQVLTYEDFDENGNIKSSVEQTAKYMIIEIDVPGFVEGFIDYRTTIRFLRPDKDIDEKVSYTLAEAGKAGFLEKTNWNAHQGAMLYARCFTRGSKIYFSDILKGLGELSEVAQYSNVPYEFDESGNVTVDTTYQEVEEDSPQEEEDSPLEIIVEPSVDAQTNNKQEELK